MTKFFTKITGRKTDDEIAKEENDISVKDEANSDLENDFDIQEQETLISPNPKPSVKEEWLDKEESEGQLSVDVYQTKDNVIIKSTIAGVKPENIDISIDNDVVTIRGQRKEEEEIKEDDYFYQECYWGSFSRSIVLPMEVKADEVEASLKNGVLTILLPKMKKSKSVAVKVKSE